jgi:glycosyltransferase involved in cell wall biosynthesis
VTPDGHDPDGCLLSVVIVTYNEEDRIQECLDSVISATRGLANAEVVLVDSNSTDRTVEIASEFPITILRIPDDDLTTPGAGRHVGTGATRGELVLFVDGDMVIQRPWLERAIETLRTRESVAAVDGQLNDPSGSGTITEVDAVRGVALYRAASLLSVGGFDPYLQSLEDIHLGFELTAAGHTLVRLPEVAAEHPPIQTLTEPFRRLRRGYTIGPGQALRRSLGSKELLGKHLYRMRHRLSVFAWLCLGIGSVTSPPFLVLWLALSAVATGVLVTKRGIRGLITFSIVKTLGLVGLAIGLVRSPRPPESFPMDAVETIQRGRVLSAESSPGVVGTHTDGRKYVNFRPPV